MGRTDYSMATIVHSTRFLLASSNLPANQLNPDGAVELRPITMHNLQPCLSKVVFHFQQRKVAKESFIGIPIIRFGLHLLVWFLTPALFDSDIEVAAWRDATGQGSHQGRDFFFEKMQEYGLRKATALGRS